MARVEIDTSQMRELVADMRGVDGRLARHIIPVVERGALNIKNEITNNFRASSNAGFRSTGRTVSYDIHTSSDEISAEIGPTKPAGALANIAIWGTSRGGGSVPDPAEALASEAVGFGRALGDLAEEIMW